MAAAHRLGCILVTVLWSQMAVAQDGSGLVQPVLLQETDSDQLTASISSQVAAQCPPPSVT